MDGTAVESTKELEAELLLGETNDCLLGETNDQKEDQVQSGGSSPTSPAFEVETAPAPQPVDPKEVLTELGTCIKYSIFSNTCNISVGINSCFIYYPSAEELGNDSDAKFSSDEEEL